MLRVFVSRSFGKFCKEQGIGESDLWACIDRIERGLIDADLGGGLIKQPIPRRGAGRSGGYRAFIAVRSESRAIYMFGLAKNERANVREKELAALKILAMSLLTAATEEMEASVRDGSLRELTKGER